MSDDVRVYQLAKELNVESKYITDLLLEAGTNVKPMSKLDAATRQLAEDLVRGRVTPKQARATTPAEPARPGPVPAPKAAKPAEIPSPRKRRPDTIVPTRAEADTEAEAPSATTTIDIPEPAAPVLEPAASDATEIVAAAAVEKPMEERPRESKPIPAPGRGKMVSLDTPPAGSGGARTRERRPSAPQRPIVAGPLPDSTRREPKRAPEVRTQKPVMKLSPEALRGGKPPVGVDLVPPSADVGDDEIQKKSKSPAGGALVGREERQRRRGQRAAERKLIQSAMGDEDETQRRRGPRPKLRRDLRAAKPAGPVPITLPTTVRAVSEATGVRALDLCFKLKELTGELPNINSSLTEEELGMLVMALELPVEIKRERGTEEMVEESFFAADAADADLVPRPPVVTFMGHVDHGKTSLMDKIRQANVVATEAGGITQHIGAYQARFDGHVVTFLDTPGHEAFTAMRRRGANVTDVVVLVVAADDGVMPQTEEAINHAKAAGVPILVAMNKADLPGANFDRVQQQLSQHGLIPEEWGGETIMVKTSAATGAGLDKLLESIHLLAELKELKANPTRPAIGSCIEASLNPDTGIQATLLVLNGVLKVGDVILCGPAYGRVRAMYSDQGAAVQEAGPATPVMVMGLDCVPEAGERFAVINDLARAREIAEERKGRRRIEGQSERQHVSLERLFSDKQEREVQDLRIVLKADVRGSLEAIKAELAKLDHPEVKVRVLHDAVGAVNESDVLLADTSDAIVIAFQVVPDAGAESLAKETGVEIRRYNIIYQVSDDIKKAMEGLLIPDKKEVQLGRAVVQETFSISRFGTIAGCRVIQGNIERNAQIRVIRDGTVIGAYPIESLKRHKDDVRDVREGLECGIKIANFDDVKRGDVLEAFRIEEVKRTL